MNNGKAWGAELVSGAPEPRSLETVENSVLNIQTLFDRASEERKDLEVMRKVGLLFFVGLGFFLSTAITSNARQTVKSTSQALEVPLRERVDTYYKDILKGDRMSDQEMIAPESRNQFLN